MKNIWKKLVLFASLLCLLITSTMTYGSSQSVKAKTSGVEVATPSSPGKLPKRLRQKKHRTDDREENRNDDTGSAAGDR